MKPRQEFWFWLVMLLFAFMIVVMFHNAFAPPEDGWLVGWDNKGNHAKEYK
jgi:hypothetical protein